MRMPLLPFHKGSYQIMTDKRNSDMEQAERVLPGPLRIEKLKKGALYSTHGSREKDIVHRREEGSDQRSDEESKDRYEYNEGETISPLQHRLPTGRGAAVRDGSGEQVDERQSGFLDACDLCTPNQSWQSKQIR